MRLLDTNPKPEGGDCELRLVLIIPYSDEGVTEGGGLALVFITIEPSLSEFMMILSELNRVLLVPEFIRRMK
jgi:hypothetical protein